MKFSTLEDKGRAMSEAELAASLRSLANDARFAAVVEMIRRQKELASDGAAQLQFAGNHGCLAHAGGVRYGMLELEGRIREACTPPKKRAAQPPPEQEE